MSGIHPLKVFINRFFKFQVNVTSTLHVSEKKERSRNKMRIIERLSVELYEKKISLNYEKNKLKCFFFNFIIHKFLKELKISRN